METHNRVETYTITDLQQIKALADPLRQQILGAFVAEPRTTKQVAVLLNQPSTKLYHHVDLLERVGLIRLVATKPKRGTTEKYFQAIAYRFMVAESSLGGEAGSVLEDTLAKAFASAQTEIRKAITSGPASAEEPQLRSILAFGALRIAPEDLPELQRRIMDVVKDLGSASKDSERTFYRYLVAVYPSAETESE
jgi:hypothetical protein